VLANGDIVAGGSFINAGGTPANYIARWNGTAWLAFGPGNLGPVKAMAQLPDGSLAVSPFAGGIGRWDFATQQWSQLAPGFGAGVRAMTILPDGELVSGGDFITVGGVLYNHVARLNGSSWAACGGTALGAVRGLVLLPDDQLFGGGAFGVARRA